MLTKTAEEEAGGEEQPVLLPEHERKTCLVLERKKKPGQKLSRKPYRKKQTFEMESMRK